MASVTVQPVMPADERDAPRRWAQGAIIVIVTLAHVCFVWWLSVRSNEPVLTMSKGAPPNAGVRVSLVSEPARPSVPAAVPPTAKTEPVPDRKPVPAPVRPESKRVFASERSDAMRTVDVSKPEPVLSPMNPAADVAPAAATSNPATPAPQGSADAVQLALPKPIGASQLQQLGCSIPAPVYPSAARRLGREGTVSVSITIDRTGRFSSVSVLHSSGYPDLDAAAVDAVSRGHCMPYVEDGIARIVTASQPIAFNLGG